MIQIFEIQFSAAHFYRQEQWSEEKNRAAFGLCYSKEGFGHGHDYRLQVFLKPTGTNESIQIALQKIQKHFDHKHLNYEIPEFTNLIPTTENLALLLQNMMQKTFANQYQKLRLYENDNIWTEVIP